MKDIIVVKNLHKKFWFFDKDYRRIQWLFTKKGYSKEFHVLKGLNFTIQEGETVGILGRNGAGKSTLLKIIAGIYHKTSGSVKVNGKVASLLELGAGFDSELTGRQNIYFKGTLLGFTRDYIDKIIDEIIDFADIGEYMEMPLSSYSSGMAARLGFALAVNIDPEILIIDEVFAVGDANFQKKSKAKTMEFLRAGKTVLFVSHSEELLRTFCDRLIYLRDGHIVYDGAVEEGIAMYNHDVRKQSIAPTILVENYEIDHNELLIYCRYGYGVTNEIFEAYDFNKIKFQLCKYSNDRNAYYDYDFDYCEYEESEDGLLIVRVPLRNLLNHTNVTIRYHYTDGKFAKKPYHIKLYAEGLTVDSPQYIARLSKNRYSNMLFEIRENESNESDYE